MASKHSDWFILGSVSSDLLSGKGPERNQSVQLGWWRKVPKTSQTKAIVSGTIKLIVFGIGIICKTLWELMRWEDSSLVPEVVVVSVELDSCVGELLIPWLLRFQWKSAFSLKQVPPTPESFLLVPLVNPFKLEHSNCPNKNLWEPFALFYAVN